VHIFAAKCREEVGRRSPGEAFHFSHPSRTPTISIPPLGAPLRPRRRLRAQQDAVRPSARPDDAPGADVGGNVTLEDACAVLVAALGQMKRIGYGWKCKDVIYYAFPTFCYSYLFLFGSVILSTIHTSHICSLNAISSQ
jgi:hypothetical protein